MLPVSRVGSPALECGSMRTERLDIAQHLQFEPRAFGRKFNL